MQVQLSHSDIKKIIIKSQHCQRNWDLNKVIPQEDLDLIIYSVTQCPSKQNHSFYKVHAITNRDVIENIYETTNGFLLPNDEWTTNSQTLANLLLVFEKIDTSESHKQKNKTYENNNQKTVERDIHMAVGIAAGYANFTANLLGYSTGCCACFDSDAVESILNLQGSPVLLMGIGFKNLEMNRRIHHKNLDQIFPTRIKETIEVNYIK